VCPVSSVCPSFWLQGGVVYAHMDSNNKFVFLSGPVNFDKLDAVDDRIIYFINHGRDPSDPASADLPTEEVLKSLDYGLNAGRLIHSMDLLFHELYSPQFAGTAPSSSYGGSSTPTNADGADGGGGGGGGEGGGASAASASDLPMKNEFKNNLAKFTNQITEVINHVNGDVTIVIPDMDPMKARRLSVCLSACLSLSAACAS
jgi:hypothetical protein